MARNSASASLLSRARRQLPHGYQLPEASWQGRHRALAATVAAIIPAVIIYALVSGASTTTAAIDMLMVAVPAGLGQLHILPRRYKATLVAFSLSVAAALLVQISHGQTQAHFAYFVVIGLVAFYQDAVAFAVIVAFSFVESGIVGTIAPRAVYDSSRAATHPWQWALVQTAFMVVFAAVALVAWKLTESAMVASDRSRREIAAVLDATADGIIGLDRSGAVTFANQAAQQLLGWTSRRQPIGASHQLIHDCDPLRCPLMAALDSGPTVLITDLLRFDGTPVTVEASVAPIDALDGLRGVVIDFGDLAEREAQRATAAEVARLAASEAAQRAEVLALQETLWPKKLRVPGTGLAVHYVPAEGAPVGGDFYDWVQLPSGIIQVAVVDACGKGLTATSTALGVTHALRTLTLAGVNLDELVTRADRLLQDADPDVSATLIIARYCPTSGHLQLVGASHPPAVIVSPSGAARTVSAPGLAIGYPGAGSFHVVEEHLNPGDSLILYTDGLVEGTRDIEAGISNLTAQASAGASRPAVDLAEQLVTASLAHADRRDDSLALVLRRAHNDLTVTYSADEPAARSARRLAHRYAAAAGMDEDLIDNLTLVVSELVANAAREASTGSVTFGLRRRGSSIVAAVTDTAGHPFNLPVQAPRPAADATSGRGLHIALDLCRWVGSVTSNGVTLVEAEVPLHHAPTKVR